jgi:phage terminase large subunit-like protein
MTSSSLACPPRVATRRRADRSSYGPNVAAVAQRHVVDVALEVDGSGRLAYREVRITVPRQSGKSTLVLPVVLWRAFAAEALGGPQKMLYAAQTRNDAKIKWLDDYVARIRAAKSMAGRFEVRLANGDEHVRFATGSKFGIVATTEKAAHGQTLDMPIQDEAFGLVDDRMDQAFRPAMITRPQAQFWIVSTAGHAGSVYLRRKVDEGRAAATADSGTGVAYFEWSADDEADPADPGVWASCMPALGHTVSLDAIRNEFESMDRSEFRRAYLNQWTDSITESVIPLEWWRARVDAESQLVGAPVLAVDVSPDRGRASIAAAGASSTGNATHLELVDCRAGTDWVVERVRELSARHRPRAVVVDDIGPAGSLAADLRAAGVEPVPCGTRGLVQACGQLFDAARDGGIVHLGDPTVEVALRNAATRQLGDAWAWKRRTSASDISPLVTVTLAAWGHVSQPAVQLWAARL